MVYYILYQHNVDIKFEKFAIDKQKNSMCSMRFILYVFRFVYIYKKTYSLTYTQKYIYIYIYIKKKKNK